MRGPSPGCRTELVGEPVEDPVVSSAAVRRAQKDQLPAGGAAIVELLWLAWPRAAFAVGDQQGRESRRSSSPRRYAKIVRYSAKANRDRARRAVPGVAAWPRGPGGRAPRGASHDRRSPGLRLPGGGASRPGARRSRSWRGRRSQAPGTNGTEERGPTHTCCAGTGARSPAMTVAGSAHVTADQRAVGALAPDERSAISAIASSRWPRSTPSATIRSVGGAMG